MRYNTNREIELIQATAYFKKLSDSKSIIDLKKVHKGRSLSQNSYLHVLFQLFGIETGYTLQEAKHVVKYELGYTYFKDGYTFLDKTSAMTTREMTNFVDKFRVLTLDMDIHLPLPNQVNDELLNYIELNKNIL